MSPRMLIASAAIALVAALPAPAGARYHRPDVELGERVGPAGEETAERIERLLRRSLRGATTSVFVADAATGERLFSVEPDARLNPASNVKLIATAAALDLLGPDHRYPTWVLGPPPDDRGVVGGDLYLLGSYDPTLDPAGVDDLAGQLAATGVRKLRGDVVVGGSPSRDGVFRSYVELTIEAGAPGTPPVVTMTPPNQLIQIEVKATSSRARRPAGGVEIATELTADQDGHRRLRLVVAGKVGRGRTLERRVWIRERALLTAHLLREALRARGVEIHGDVRITPLADHVAVSLLRGVLPLPLAEHRSRPLASIVQDINKWSTNWLADRIIMTAAAHRYGGAPSMDKAIAAMYAWLDRRIGLGPDDLLIDTGSGLSYRTAMSSRQIVEVVRAAMQMGAGPAYRESLAIGGRDGTLRRRFEDLDATVLGKTGTLTGVIALSGLLEVSSDRKLIFSIITNGHRRGRRAAVRRAQEELVGFLAEYLHRP